MYMQNVLTIQDDDSALYDSKNSKPEYTLTTSYRFIGVSMSLSNVPVVYSRINETPDNKNTIKNDITPSNI